MRLLENQWKKLDAYSVIVTNGITRKDMIIIKRLIIIKKQRMFYMKNDAHFSSVKLKSDRVNQTLGHETTTQIPNP
jgi:hypothetical protein